MFKDNLTNDYLQYFTTRFAQLLMHCYNTVENLAMEKEFGEHFHDDGSGGGPGGNSDGNLSGSTGRTSSGTSVGTSGGGSSGYPGGGSSGNPVGNNTANPAGTPAKTIKALDDLTRSKYFKFCDQYTTFPEQKIEIDTLVLKNISHIFVEGKKTLHIFLQRNGANVTQLEFSRGSLKFESLIEILQKLPNLRKIVFDEIKYQVPETKQIIDRATCQNLEELEISKNTEIAAAQMLQEAFQKYNNIKITNIGRKTPAPNLAESKVITSPLAVKASSTESVMKPRGLDLEKSKLYVMDLPSTSKGFEKLPDQKPILKALNEDGSIDMELLKRICRGCLKGLKKRHDEGKCQ